MLTSDLVQTQLEDGRVEPQYLAPDDAQALQKAETLISAFNDNLGNQKADLDDAVKAITDDGTDYKTWRGLAKLLRDRSEFEVDAPIEPSEIRSTVFEFAASSDETDPAHRREEVLEEAAAELDVSANELDGALYADLESRKILSVFDELEPTELINRYNLALAQAVLYSATDLEIELTNPDPNHLRDLFHVLKVNRRMHRCEQTETGYRLSIDGPASLFESNRKYGIRLATFLPAVVLGDDWRLEATLQWDDDERLFELDDRERLKSHYTANAQWKAREEKDFESKFTDTETDWSLERRGDILELPDNQVLVSDYRLEHPDGRQCYLEIVGFWRLDYLERRIQLLRESSDLPLILAVSDRLKTGRRTLEESPAEVFFFKTVILVDKVLEAAESVG